MSTIDPDMKDITIESLRAYSAGCVEEIEGLKAEVERLKEKNERLAEEAHSLAQGGGPCGKDHTDRDFALSYRCAICLGDEVERLNAEVERRHVPVACATCGREAIAGDCYGCEADRLTAVAAGHQEFADTVHAALDLAEAEVARLRAAIEAEAEWHEGEETWCRSSLDVGLAEKHGERARVLRVALEEKP